MAVIKKQGMAYRSVSKVNNDCLDCDFYNNNLGSSDKSCSLSLEERNFCKRNSIVWKEAPEVDTRKLGDNSPALK